MTNFWRRKGLFVSTIMLSRSLLLAESFVTATARTRCRPPFIATPIIRFLSKSDDSENFSTVKQYALDKENCRDNLYREWSVEQDKELWENRFLALPDLAARLGRGLGGVENRLTKLKDVSHAAYQRLFVTEGVTKRKPQKADVVDDLFSTKQKLVPVTEVIRRIKWSLDPTEFSLVHYDRVDDSLVDSPFIAPNQSIQGKSTMLIDAIPEHRIMAIKFRDRIVWDRKKKLDLVFADEGIEHVMKTYDYWKSEQQTMEDLNRQRETEITTRLRQVLGSDSFEQLQDLSVTLLSNSAIPSVSTKLECETFTETALELFREVRRNPSQSQATVLIPDTDYEALDLLSELVALLPDEEVCRSALTEIALCMTKVTGKETEAMLPKILPELNERDITETFIRGSGPGGQKINKTSNRVLLIHGPTQIRVECQETRSLQQNRKIARKRLQLKLDEYYNGSQSRESIKTSKASTKKAKAKTRARKRQRQKQQANDDDDDDGDDDETNGARILDV
jgi:uncharacterized protein (UPF0248 family)